MCLKNIPDIFICNLKNDYQIVIISYIIPDTNGHQFPTSPTQSASALPGENGTNEILGYILSTWGSIIT